MPESIRRLRVLLGGISLSFACAVLPGASNVLADDSAPFVGKVCMEDAALEQIRGGQLILAGLDLDILVTRELRWGFDPAQPVPPDLGIPRASTAFPNGVPIGSDGSLELLTLLQNTQSGASLLHETEITVELINAWDLGGSLQQARAFDRLMEVLPP